MSKWLSDPRVLEFYEGRDHPLAFEQFQSEYAPRIRGEEDVTPCLIILQSVPIGYMQFYLVGEESRNLYGRRMNASRRYTESTSSLAKFRAGIAAWARDRFRCCCGICFRLFLIPRSRICSRFGAVRNADSALFLDETYNFGPREVLSLLQRSQEIQNRLFFARRQGVKSLNVP
jgi:Acetyltransferase (GNAT) domain